MSHNKAIESGKEHRKPYRKSKAVSKRCRNHGTCGVCTGNRKHKFRDLDADFEDDDFQTGNESDDSEPEQIE